MNKLQESSGNVTVFLDAVLSARSGWQLALERSAQSLVDPATMALLAKAHGTRLGVLDAAAENGAAQLPKMGGALVVCTTESLQKPDLLLRQLPPKAALLVLGEDDPASPDSQPLAQAGFRVVDAISVPHNSTFWLRSATRSEFLPAAVARAFSSCLNNKGGMGTSQYFRVVAEIMSDAPCDLLVFGAGADTALYTEINAGGRTVVVEHREGWRDTIADVPCEMVPVDYETTVQAGLLDEVSCPKGFPPALIDVPWSVILVDSPEGHVDDMPGRQQSIFTAYQASRHGATVFLHDYNRPLERAAADKYFGKADEVVGKKPSLAVFNTGGRRTAPVAAAAKPAAERVAQAPKSTIVAPPPKSTVAVGALDVSVIIPTYNEGDWLKRTVESVLAAKTEMNYEIVVVDDASDDGSVEEVRNLPRVRVVSVGDDPVGCVIGRNLGAKASRGDYVCYLDSHVLVRDEWLERLRETCTQYQDRALVSGNILNVDHEGKPNVETQQYAYTLKAWSVESAWHFHGHAKKTEPYRAPLCPAGLMFARRSYFMDLGGFSERIRKWGGTDVEISLKNYLYGGENIVDPRVFIYHYYKNTKDRKPTFTISYKQTFFNRLFIANAYCSDEVYKNAQAVLAKKAKIGDFVADVESEDNQRYIQQLRKRFVRNWDDFAKDFELELKHCFTPLDDGKG